MRKTDFNTNISIINLRGMISFNLPLVIPEIVIIIILLLHTDRYGNLYGCYSSQRGCQKSRNRKNLTRKITLNNSKLTLIFVIFKLG